MSENNFNFDRLLQDRLEGRVSGFAINVDPAHDGKPTAIDLHVMFPDREGIKYKELGGVQEFREQLGDRSFTGRITDADLGF